MLALSEHAAANVSGADPYVLGSQTVHDDLLCVGAEGDEDQWNIPYVRNTFLNCGASLGSRQSAEHRTRSAPVSCTCDRYVTEVHALMFKVRPVRQQRTPSILRRTKPATPSLDVSAVEDAVEVASMNIGDEGKTPASTAREPTDSSAAEDVGTSETDAREPEQEKVSDEECLESVLARVPYDDAGRPTSLGSWSHAFGECRPCAFLGDGRRPCVNGVRCPFCHFPHSTRRRIRLCRRKRLEMRAAVVAAVTEAGSDGISQPPRYVPVSWPCQDAAETLKGIHLNGA